MRREEWVEIHDFPGYAVSDLGRVINLETDYIKIPSPNQHGVYSVLLMRDGVQYRRGVANLVATTFLGIHMRENFDTPINLNGDRNDNRIENLTWRPRWFALMYHAQLKRPTLHGFKARLLVQETRQVFDGLRELATTYGLLEREVLLSLETGIPVFPHWHTYAVLD